MFDFHESLMRGRSDFFLGIERRCNSFHVGADVRDFPVELEVPRPSPLSWLNSIELNARYAAEDAIKKSKRKLKVGGWSKFNLILPVGLAFQIKGTLHREDDSEILSILVIVVR